MKFITNDDQLTIKLEGMEMLWGLKRKLVLPREKIVDLVWVPEFDTSDLMLRIGGSNIPKVLLAGHFRDIDTKETLYLYLRRPAGMALARSLRDANVLSVTMQDYSYAKVIVNAEPDTGAALMNWFSLSKP